MGNAHKGSLPDRWRKHLSEAGVLSRLIKHFNNELDVPLDSGQVQLGVAFMRKLLPDLQASTHEVNHNHNLMDVHNLTARLAALGHDPETVFKRISTGQVIEAEPVDNLLVTTEQPVDKNQSESDPIEEGGTPE